MLDDDDNISFDQGNAARSTSTTTLSTFPTTAESSFSVSQFYGGKDKRNGKARCKSTVIEYRIPKYYYPGFSGPSVCWETFYRQQEAFEYVDKNSENKLAVFAFESSTGQENGSTTCGGGRRYLVSSLKQFWHHYRDLHSNQRHHYEVIREGCRCKLYFDLEFMKELNNDRNGNRMVDTLIKYVCLWLKEYFGVKCDRSNVLDLDSSTATKFSRHLIFQMESAVFDSATVAGYFVRHIFALLVQYLNVKSRKGKATSAGVQRSSLRERSTNHPQNLRSYRTGRGARSRENKITGNSGVSPATLNTDGCELSEIKLFSKDNRLEAKHVGSIQDFSTPQTMVCCSPRKKVKTDSSKEPATQREETVSVWDDVMKSFEESSDEEEHSFLTASFSTGSKSLFSSSESCPGLDGRPASETVGWDGDSDDELVLEGALLEQELQTDKGVGDPQHARVCDWDSDLDDEYEHIVCCPENDDSHKRVSCCDYEFEDFDDEIALTDMLEDCDGMAGSEKSFRAIDTEFTLDSTDDLFLNLVTQDCEKLVRRDFQSKRISEQCHISGTNKGYDSLNHESECPSLTLDKGCDVRNRGSECSTLVKKYDTECGTIPAGDSLRIANRSKPVDEGISLEEWTQIKELYDMRLFSDDEDDDCDDNLSYMERLKVEPNSASVLDDSVQRICGQFSLDELKSLLVKDKNGRDTTFCDLGVYTKNRNFRLYLSSKLNKNRPLVLSEHNRYHPPKLKNKRQSSSENEEDVFMASLISVFVPGESTRILQFGCDTPQAGSVNKVPCGDVISLSTSRAPSVESHSVRDSLLADLDRFILSLISGADKNGKIRTVKHNRERNTITYNIMGYRWCSNIGREHRSNNIFFTVELDSRTYTQGCYDVDCAHGLRKVEKIPDFVKLDPGKLSGGKES